MTDIQKLYLSVNALVIFRGLLRDDVIGKLSLLLNAKGLPVSEQATRYADFTAALFEQSICLTDYIWTHVADDDNIYAQKRALGQPVPEELAQCLAHELDVLSRLSQLRSEDVRAQLDYDGFLPSWQTRPMDFSQAYASRAEAFPQTGCGIFARYRMLRVQNGDIVPVKHPDPIRLADLKGYTRQKDVLISNTRALLNGHTAANALLYGDAGTGKSSTVKALVNEYHAQGLRLIEVPKSCFYDIPAIIDSLSESPLKFILFIDDLSFTQQTDEFNALKAVLEGSVSACAANIAIYATSNRRHMVKELFSDRESGDDIHRNETIQELISLSHRFALTVGFFRPDKQAYLDIVHKLRDEYGIDIDDAQLDLEAERFASAGRSPRTARQFINMLLQKTQSLKLI